VHALTPALPHGHIALRIHLSGRETGAPGPIGRCQHLDVATMKAGLIGISQQKP